MNRAWVLVVGLVCAVPLGVFVAGELDAQPFQAEARPGQGADESVEVLRVTDGDTILVDRDGQEDRVRTLGIDRPDVARDGQPRERCADEAAALTEELTTDADVVLVTGYVTFAVPYTDFYLRLYPARENSAHASEQLDREQGSASLNPQSTGSSRYIEQTSPRERLFRATGDSRPVSPTDTTYRQ